MPIDFIRLHISKKILFLIFIKLYNIYGILINLTQILIVTQYRKM